MNSYRVQKQAIRESPLRESLKYSVGDDVLGIPQKTNAYRAQKVQSEERKQMQNEECRMQMECRMQSAECRVKESM